MRGPYQTSPGVGGPIGIPAPLPAAGAAAQPKAATATTATAAAMIGGLGTQMREEVWAIVRAAVEEAMGPLVARARELEARVERAERDRDERTVRARGTQGGQTAPLQTVQGGAGGSSAASKLASIGPVPGGGPSSIPVAFGPSASPPAFARAPSVPLFEASPGSVTDPGMTTIPDLKVPSFHQNVRVSAHPVGPRGSLPPQGYGVSVMLSTRPKLDLDSVGAIDISGFDGGARKRKVYIFVVVLMLVIVTGAVVMTVLSHN